MKAFIISLCLLATLNAHAQIFESFTNGIPAGWHFGQGMSLTTYENPLNNCSSDRGATTSTIATLGKSYIATPEIPYTANYNLQVSFKIFVFDANIKCNTTKDFPCDSYVKVYLVQNNYTSSAPPPVDVILAESTLQLMQGNQLNTVLFSAGSLASIANGTLYRVYIDFNVPMSCNQGNTKYVMDEIRVLEQAQSTLPVKFSSFTASRKNRQVNLEWETSTEVNNLGFNVQKKTGNEEWKTLDFIPSKAEGGNSTSNLKYQYSEVNISENVLQYRLQQVDVDGKIEYSETRSIKAEKQFIPVLLYPNPAKGGKVNLAFNDPLASYEVSLVNASGKTIRTFKNFNGGRLEINGLNRGFYLLTITDLVTKQSFSEKLIVE